MTVMDANISRPKAHKKASKKNKKSWRKNTDIEDVEEFLEDQRLEERLGGAFDKRTDSDIFVVDNSKATSIGKPICLTSLLMFTNSLYLIIRFESILIGSFL